MPPRNTKTAQTFAQALRDAIEVSGLSQAEVARRMDLRAATISSWVNGVNKSPAPALVWKLEKVLAVRPPGALGSLLGYAVPADHRPAVTTIEDAIRGDAEFDPLAKTILLNLVRDLRRAARATRTIDGQS